MTFLAAIIAIATVPAIAVATLTLPSGPPDLTSHSSFASSGQGQGRAVRTTCCPADHRGPLSASDSTSSTAAGRSSASGPPDSPALLWVWPLLPIPRVVRGFQVGPDPWSPGHRGVDLEARPGAAVHAPAGGVIRFSSELAGRYVLAIDHGGGLISSFEPAIGRLPVGTKVQAGDAVATLAPGPNHCSPGSCLHWGVRRDERYLDPLTLLPGLRGPAVLLPMPS